ncbi:MAG: hypothetical protein AAGE89_12380 [Pseudomonadota bacterium]
MSSLFRNLALITSVLIAISIAQASHADNLRPARASVSWAHSEGTPNVTAGTMLAVNGLPRGFEGNALAVGKDGDEYALDVVYEKDALDDDGEPLNYWVLIPMPKGRPSVSDTFRITFDGLETAPPLTVEVMGVRPIDGATSKLVRILAQGVYRDLTERDIDPVQLLADADADPETIPTELIPAVTILRTYRLAGQGDPFVSFLRDGDMPDWIIESDVSPQRARRAFDTYATALLTDLGLVGAVEKEPPGFQRISSPALKRGVSLQKAVYRPSKFPFAGNAIDTFPSAREPMLMTPINYKVDAYLRKIAGNKPIIETIEDVPPALEAGRAQERYLKVNVNAGKKTLKLAEWTIGLHPAVGAGVAIVDFYATMHQQHHKALMYQFPKTIALVGRPLPERAMFADDKAPTKLAAGLMAYGESYQVFLIQDGADAAIGSIGMAQGAFDLITKSNKGFLLGKKAIDVVEGRVLAALKGSAIKWEKGQDKKKKAVVSKTIRAREWGPLPIEERHIGPYFDLVYEGAWRARPKSLTNKVCWNGEPSARAELFARPSAFLGLKDVKAYDWKVSTPKLRLSTPRPAIAFGESTKISSHFSGSQQKQVRYYPPERGEIWPALDNEAIYQAPDQPEDAATCYETAAVTASYPTDESRICAAAPTAVKVITIERPDRRIKLPASLNCKPGETVSFAVTHPKRAVQCRLTGPGRFSMADGMAHYTCPKRVSGSARIDCFTGPDKSICSPHIDINQRVAKFGAYLEVDGLRNDEPDANVSPGVLIGLVSDQQNADEIIARNEPLMEVALGFSKSDFANYGLPGIDFSSFVRDRDVPVPCPSGPGVVTPGTGLCEKSPVEKFEPAPQNGKFHRSLPLVPEAVIPSFWRESLFYSNIYIDESDDPRKRRRQAASLNLSVTSPEEDTFLYKGSGQYNETIDHPAGSLLGSKVTVRAFLATKFKVSADTKLSVRMETKADAPVSVHFTPMLLMEGIYPVTLVGAMFKMMPNPTRPEFLNAPPLIEHEITLPGPPEGYDFVEYVVHTVAHASPELEKTSATSMSGNFNWEGHLTFKTSPIRNARSSNRNVGDEGSEPKIDWDADRGGDANFDN